VRSAARKEWPFRNGSRVEADGAIVASAARDMEI
jgi:hypothetical protein